MTPPLERYVVLEAGQFAIEMRIEESDDIRITELIWRLHQFVRYEQGIHRCSEMDRTPQVLLMR